MFLVRVLVSATLLLRSSVAASEQLFASDFQAPQAPSALVADYQASYVQHKWDGTGISHISSGMIYAGRTAKRLRMDLAHQGVLASSLFDYGKAINEFIVPNYMYTFSRSTASTGVCAHYNVTPAYPLFQSTILADMKATFAGLFTDDLFYANQGQLQAWEFLFAGTVSVKFFLNSKNTVVRMDFSSPDRSTFTTTRLFNIVPGAPADDLLVSPCPTDPPSPASSGGRRSV